jgi:RimJ/RimL family protein N-acetyltransferase
MLRKFEEEDWDALHSIFEDEECVRYTIGAPLKRWQTWRTLAGYIGHWELRGYGPYALVSRGLARAGDQRVLGSPVLGTGLCHGGRCSGEGNGCTRVGVAPIN